MLILGGQSNVTCVATDPDGDSLSYTWSVTGGKISGTGNAVIWNAPGADADFVVNVTVDDGKGGTAGKQLTIIAGAPQRTIVLEPIPNESGSVYSSGDLAASWMVGDNAANNGVRAFFSFNLSGLALAEIKEANLTFNTRETVGKPWLISAFLHVDQVDYGKRALQGGDFDLSDFELAKSANAAPSTLDVSLPISRLLRSPVQHRLQLRLRLAQPTNNNSQDDYISLSGASINITYVK
ncbi:hypothetical protein ACFLU8_01325 [Chloroflexota bacterium]